MKELQKRYLDLQADVLAVLRERIKESDYVSYLTDEQSIQYNYTDEIAVIDGQLSYLYASGVTVPLYQELSLKQIIEFLSR